MTLVLKLPSGLLNPLEPGRPPPTAPLYFSELVAPTRSLCWMVDLVPDTVGTRSASVSFLMRLGLRGPTEWGTEEETVLTPVTYRYATRPFVSGTTPVEGRLGPVRIERQLEIGGGGYYSPMATSTAGEVALANDDGALDDLGLGPVLAGRPIRLRVAGLVADAEGRDALPDLDDFSQLASGTIGSITWSRSKLRLQVTDDRLKWARAVQDVAYTGGGGVSGPTDLAGVTKPLTYGRCFNVSPAPLDPFKLIYQFHDGEARAVDAVYDSGVPLTLHSTVDSYTKLLERNPVDPTVTTPQPGDFTIGQFVACPAAGCFRLGGLPAGRVTADVRGYGGSDGAFEYWDDGTLFDDGTGWEPEGVLIHARTVPQIAITLLRKAGISNLNVAQFAQLDEDEPREAGLYFPPGGGMTVSDALTLLLQGNGCFLYKSGDGVYQLRRLDVPGAPSFTVDTGSIVAGSLEVQPPPWREPWSRWRVRYARNWTVMSDDEIAGAVASDKRTFFQREAGQAEDGDLPTAVIHPARSPAVVDTALVYETDAKAQARRLKWLYHRTRVLWRFRSKGVGFRGELGDTIRVKYDRFGMQSGRLGILVGIREDGASGETELTVLG